MNKHIYMYDILFHKRKPDIYIHIDAPDIYFHVPDKSIHQHRHLSIHIYMYRVMHI